LYYLDGHFYIYFWYSFTLIIIFVYLIDYFYFCTGIQFFYSDFAVEVAMNMYTAMLMFNCPSTEEAIQQRHCNLVNRCANIDNLFCAAIVIAM